MDSKIKKQARTLEFMAWILMFGGIFRWITKWAFDWIFYGLGKFTGAPDMSKYKTLTEAYEKLPSDQRYLNFINAVRDAEYGGTGLRLLELSKLSWYTRLLGFLLDGIAIGILLVGFWFFIKLMLQFKKGSIFSSTAIELLNKLSKVIFWFALYLPINRSMVSLIMVFQNPPGQRYFALFITLGDMFIFAASYFFLILTSLMRDSRQLQEEQKLTV